MEMNDNRTGQEDMKFETRALPEPDLHAPVPGIKKPEPKGNFVLAILDFVKTLLISFGIVFILWTYIVKPVQVEGNSMYPSLQDGSIGFSNVLGYKLGGLDRFDISIIYLDGGNKYLVKRVIGMPGETVSYKDGSLYINGEVMEEPFLETSYTSGFDVFTEDFEEVTLGPDEYFCMGDNRPYSRDSRYYGPFTKSQMSSKGVFVVLPLQQFGVKSW